VGQKNMVMSSTRPGTRDYCAGEPQQQFTRPINRLSERPLVPQNDSVARKFLVHKSKLKIDYKHKRAKQSVLFMYLGACDYRRGMDW
jgi:hypothetical protein